MWGHETGFSMELRSPALPLARATSRTSFSCSPKRTPWNGPASPPAPPRRFPPWRRSRCRPSSWRSRTLRRHRRAGNQWAALAAALSPPPSRFSLTGFLAEVDRVVVGARQLPHDLSVLFVFGQPAVTGEAERLVHGLVPHVDALQVPAGSGPCKVRLPSRLATTWFNPAAIIQCGRMAEVSSLHSRALAVPSIASQSLLTKAGSNFFRKLSWKDPRGDNGEKDQSNFEPRCCRSDWTNVLWELDCVFLQ